MTLLLPDSEISPNGKDNSQPNRDSMANHTEMSVKQSEDSPTARVFFFVFQSASEKIVSSVWQVSGHDHAVCHSQPSQNQVCRRYHLFPATKIKISQRQTTLLCKHYSFGLFYCLDSAIIQAFVFAKLFINTNIKQRYAMQIKRTQSSEESGEFHRILLLAESQYLERRQA